MSYGVPCRPWVCQCLRLVHSQCTFVIVVHQSPNVFGEHKKDHREPNQSVRWKGGREIAKRGSEYFKKLQAKRKNRRGGRPLKAHSKSQLKFDNLTSGPFLVVANDEPKTRERSYRPCFQPRWSFKRLAFVYQT